MDERANSIVIASAGEAIQGDMQGWIAWSRCSLAQTLRVCLRQ